MAQAQIGRAALKCAAANSGSIGNRKRFWRDPELR
jgi:hypothetical protein